MRLISHGCVEVDMQNIVEYSTLKMSVQKLDKWFSDFLKGKGKKMDHEKVDEKLWQEYHTKYREYSKLCQKIRLIETK